MPETWKRDTPGLVGCAIVIALGCAALAGSTDFTPLGAVFPRTIAGLMIAFGLLYIVLTLRRPMPQVRADAGSNPRRLGTMAVMLAWAFALQPVGFLFSSICASVALLMLAQYDRWTARTAFLYALATAIVIGGLYSLFRFALQVPLPVGLFW
jgi:putative tricarboxylic transport membrane protein